MGRAARRSPIVIVRSHCLDPRSRSRVTADELFNALRDTTVPNVNPPYPGVYGRGIYLPRSAVIPPASRAFVSDPDAHGGGCV